MKTGPFKMNPGFNKLPADVQAKILKKAPTKMYGKSPAKKDRKGMSVMDFDETLGKAANSAAFGALYNKLMGGKPADVDLTKKKGLGPRVAATKKKAPMKNYKKGYYGA